MSPHEAREVFSLRLTELGLDHACDFTSGGRVRVRMPGEARLRGYGDVNGHTDTRLQNVRGWLYAVAATTVLEPEVAVDWRIE